MRKKYVSPLFAELELESVLYDSGYDNTDEDNPFVEGGDGGDFDEEDDFDS